MVFQGTPAKRSNNGISLGIRSFLLSDPQVALVVKNPPVKAGDREADPSLGQEDTLEEGMATDSSILAWRIPRSEEPGGLRSIGLQRGKGFSTLSRTVLEMQALFLRLP